MSSSGHLIFIAPRVGQFWKTSFTRRTLLILALAFIASFLCVVLLGYTYPALVDEADRLRLETENQSLRIANKDLRFQVLRLNSRVETIEGMSNHVAASIGAD